MYRSHVAIRTAFPLLLFVCLIFLNACKKSNGSGNQTPSTTYISYNFNGTARTLKIAGFNSFMDGSTYVCNINASSDDPSDHETINLLLKSQSPIIAGTYGNDNSGTTVEYRTSDNLSYSVVNTNITIVLEKIDANGVQGNFSVTIPAGNTTIKLTNGLFNCSPRM